MTTPRPCPGCGKALVDTATPHCREMRATPCGWVVCKCGVTSDRYGNHYPRKAP